MLDVTYRCDFCHEIVSEQEYIEQKICRKSPVIEINLSNYLVCDKCAAKINYAILKFKKENNLC